MNLLSYGDNQFEMVNCSLLRPGHFLTVINTQNNYPLVFVLYLSLNLTY